LFMGCEVWVGMSVRVVGNDLSKLLYFTFGMGVRYGWRLLCVVLFYTRQGMVRDSAAISIS
jgi:hypothetical protein